MALETMTMDELQEAYNTLEEQQAAIQEQKHEIALERNRRLVDDRAQAVLDSLDPDAQAALVRLGTLQLGAQVHGVGA